MIETATFQNLSLQPCYLEHRSSSVLMDTPFSIHISSLLHAIHTIVCNDNGQKINLQAMPGLYQIFSGLSQVSSFPNTWILVATSQAPVFDSRMLHCSHNYRRLGPLASIPASPTLLNTGKFEHTHEVLAVDPKLDIPEVQNLRACYDTMGLTLAKHFIIIFDYITTPDSVPGIQNGK